MKIELQRKLKTTVGELKAFEEKERDKTIPVMESNGEGKGGLRISIVIRQQLQIALSYGVKPNALWNVAKAILKIANVDFDRDLSTTTAHRIKAEMMPVGLAYVGGEWISSNQAHKVVSMSDGTTHQAKNLQVEAICVENNGITRILMLGVDTHANHTTEEQLNGLERRLESIRNAVEQVPSIRAKGDSSVIRQESFRVIIGDHANDVKSRKKTWDSVRQVIMYVEVGLDAWSRLTDGEKIARVTEEEDKFIGRFVGWDAIPKEQQEAVLAQNEDDIRKAALLTLGKQTYAKMTKMHQARLWREYVVSCDLSVELGASCCSYYKGALYSIFCFAPTVF